MLRAVSLQSATITEIVEHIRFHIYAEWLEQAILHAYTHVDRPLIAWSYCSFQCVRRVGGNDVLLVERATYRHLKCYTTCGISIETSLAPNTIRQTQRYAHIVYLLHLVECGTMEITFKFRLQMCIGDASAKDPVWAKLLVE